MNKPSYKELVEKINQLEKKLLDIECIQGEKDIQYSEINFRYLIENIPDVIWVSDEFGNTTYISHNIEKIYGFTSKEIYNSGTDLWFGKIHPDDIDRVKKSYQQLFIDNEKFDIEYRIRKKDGNWLWLRDRTVTKYEKDNKRYAYGIFTDITERKQIENALRECEERFQWLSEATSEGIIIIDGDKVIDANMKLAQIIGYELSEIIGMSGLEFIAPESRELVAKNIFESYEIPYEATGLKKDGTIIHVEVSSKSIPYHGRIVRMSSIRDITERKRAEKALRESEERYRTIFETAAISIWEYDWKEAALIIEELKTRVITDYKKYFDDHPDVIREIISLIRLCDVNEETLRLYGAKNKEELMKQVGKHSLPESFDLFRNVVIAYIEGKTCFESETVNETLDGKRINIISRISIPTSKQLLNRVLVTVTDITGRKRLENQRYVLQQLRGEVLKMTGMEDIQRVLQVFRENIKIADIPFKDGCINVIKELDEPPVIHSYALTRGNGWTYSIPDKAKKIIMQIWEKDVPSYRRDITREDIYGEQEIIREVWGSIRSVLDVPFSHGTLAINSDKADAFSRDDIKFIQEITQILSEGFHRAEDLQRLALSERLYRTLVETPTDTVVMLITVKGKYLYISPQIKVLTGYTPMEFYEHKDFIKKTIHPDDIREREKAFQKISGGAPVRNLEFRWTNKSGDITWASETIFPIYTDTGGVEAVQTVIHNITDRKQAEEQIKDSLREKEVLIREIHHRVKNNMQVISSLLMLQADRIKSKHYRNIFHESINRVHAMALIHTMLYQSESLSLIDFNEYITKICDNLSDIYMLRIGRIAILVDINNVFLKMDTAIPCGLIINELISNSIKHAFPNRRKGKITLSMREIKNNLIELRVHDNGVGLPENLDWRKTDSLGLKITTLLVENQLGGKIDLIRSEGSEFRITFTR